MHQMRMELFFDDGFESDDMSVWSLVVVDL